MSGCAQAVDSCVSRRLRPKLPRLRLLALPGQLRHVVRHRAACWHRPAGAALSTITQQSAARLALAPGVDLFALVKASSFSPREHS